MLKKKLSLKLVKMDSGIKAVVRDTIISLTQVREKFPWLTSICIKTNLKRLKQRNIEKLN